MVHAIKFPHNSFSGRFRIYNNEVITVELFVLITELKKDAATLEALQDDNHEGDKIISRDEYNKLNRDSENYHAICLTLEEIKLCKQRLDTGIADSGELDQLNNELENYL